MAERIPEHSSVLLLNIDNAKTLEELGFLTLDFFIVKSKIDRKYIDALASRVSWISGESKTFFRTFKSLTCTNTKYCLWVKNIFLLTSNYFHIQNMRNFN